MINRRTGILSRIYHATWGRFIYPWLLQRELNNMEMAGLGTFRQGLLSEAHGTTLEIGPGTGRNLDHYPAAVTSLDLVEAYRPLEKIVARRVKTMGPFTSLHHGWGEHLPFGDATFDTVVATMLLCTVEDPATFVTEVMRVLKPGGRYLFLEHVRSCNAELARKQDRWRFLWWLSANGCNPNRPTLQTLQGLCSGRMSLDYNEARMPGAAEIVSPMIYGSVTKPAVHRTGVATPAEEQVAALLH